MFPVATGSTELLSYLTFLIWNRWFPLSITAPLPVIVWYDKYINRWTEIYFFDQWAWESASSSTSFMYYWLHDRSLRVIIHSLTFILTTCRGVSLIFAPGDFSVKGRELGGCFQWSSVTGRSERSADGIHLGAALTSPLATTNRLVRHRRAGSFLCRCMRRGAIFKSHPNRKDARRPHLSRQTAWSHRRTFFCSSSAFFWAFFFFCTGVFISFLLIKRICEFIPGVRAEGRLEVIGTVKQLGYHVNSSDSLWTKAAE